MDYVIREMTEQDLSAVASLESELFTDAWSEASLGESLAQTHVKMIVAAIKDTDQVIGYHIFYMAVDEGDVARIAVAPLYRRNGVAERLLDYIWEYAETHDIERVMLEVRESNEAAITLYKKHGFQPLGIRKNYYHNPLEHGVIMEKQIDITTSICEG